MDLQRAKIYNDGSHFIATPRNAFPHRRGRKYKLSRQPFSVQKIDLPHANSPPVEKNENLPPTTPKESLKVLTKKVYLCPSEKERRISRNNLKTLSKTRKN